MDLFLKSLLVGTLFCQIAFGEIFHIQLDPSSQAQFECVFKKEEIAPFDELIVSWSANRPEAGFYLIQLNVLITEWSDWFDYAYWGSNDQYTFKQTNADIEVFQDALELLNGNTAKGFKVRVLAKEGACLKNFRSIHALANLKVNYKLAKDFPEDGLVEIPMAGLSQIALQDPLALRLCSPTSTTAVLSYLKQKELSPLAFSDQVKDSAFDIYGNWILNTAQASHVLGREWNSYVNRLSSFEQVVELLKEGFPIVVSVKGPLKDSALPYHSGHLLVIRGYDGVAKEVLCMDPAFSHSKSTLVRYKWDDFYEAWNRRKGLAYIFESID